MGLYITYQVYRLAFKLYRFTGRVYKDYKGSIRLYKKLHRLFMDARSVGRHLRVCEFFEGETSIFNCYNNEYQSSKLKWCDSKDSKAKTKFCCGTPIRATRHHAVRRGATRCDAVRRGAARCGAVSATKRPTFNAEILLLHRLTFQRQELWRRRP